MSWRLLAILARVGIGIVLVTLTLGIVVAMIRTPETQHFFVAIGMLLGALWWAFTRLPDWLQEILRSIWKYWSRRDDD
jgi:hypothetical protein